MKNKNNIWCAGYIVSMALVFLLFLTELPREIDLVVGILFGVIIFIQPIILLCISNSIEKKM